MEIEWWHWFVMGVSLVLLELMFVSFFVLWFGLGAMIVGGLIFLVPGMTVSAQLFAWIAASSMMTVLWFRVFRQSKKDGSRFTASEIIGEAGLLVAPVAPFQKGKVRFQKPILGTDEWTCISEQEIASGERVIIVMIEGNLLKVARP